MSGENMNNKKIAQNFWEAMGTNDFYSASQLLHDEFILEWPQSGERIFGKDNFAAINTQYPANGKWVFTINQLVSEGNTIVSDVSVSDGIRHDRVITFSTIRDKKIWRQVEFWPDPFEAAAWRAQWVVKE